MTQQMIDEWREKTKDLLVEHEHAAEPGTVWYPHPLHQGKKTLCRRGMFGGQCPPMAYGSRISAETMAHRVGGKTKKFKGNYHIVKEDSTPSQLQGLDPSQDVAVVGGPLGEDQPKTTQTIKAVVRAKYKRRLL
jgi:hypothetical protein